MTTDQLRKSMLGPWQSIAPELRPSSLKTPDGNIKPFFLTRAFHYEEGDRFTLQVTQFADPYGKTPLSLISLTGHIEWQGEHPIAAGAQKVRFTADEEYWLTPLSPAFADILNKTAANGFEHWEVNKGQSILKKAFPLFGLSAGQLFSEYDLIYLVGNFLFWGARHVDGRGFDTEENRPTNLQIPLQRQSHP